MIHLLRIVLAVFLAALLAVPTTGNEGGENGGGTGVWILPRSSFLAEIDTGCQAFRSEFTAGSLSDLQFKVDALMGQPTATFVSDVDGSTYGLTVVGSIVRCPKELLQVGVGARGTILITDSSGRGYVLLLSVDEATGLVTIRVP